MSRFDKVDLGYDAARKRIMKAEREKRNGHT